MLIAQPAFPHYVDTDGSPITSGSLYYGNVGANPRTSPVAVYWDAAGTQPAPQPIRTVAGYPVRNGSPANVYVNGAYSVALYNAAGELVFYAPDSAAFDAVLSATSAFMRTLLDDPDAATARGTLGVPSTSEALLKTGGTMTGKIVLDGDATLALHPVSLQQLGTALSDRVRFANRVTLATTSGVAVDLNSLPTWAQRITVIPDKVSTSGTDQVCLQLGTSASFETTSYEGSSCFINSTAGAAVAANIGSGGFSLPLANSASTRSGRFVLERVDGNVWECCGDIGDTATAAVVLVRGRKSLSGALTRIRLTTILGSDTFDGGQVSMIVEGW